MTTAKLYPYINRFSGEILVMPKSQGRGLNEDWELGKVVKNSDGKKVFRFKLSSPVIGSDGNVHIGTATVDLTESDEYTEEADGE